MVQASVTAAAAGEPNVLAKALRLNVAVTCTTALTGEYAVFQQSIEGNVFSRAGFGTAAAKTLTLSFMVYAPLTGTYSGALRNNVANRSYPFTYTVDNANTWERKTITILGDTSGTWPSDVNMAARLSFDLGSGDTFRGTAGAWSGSNLVGATGTAGALARTTTSSTATMTRRTMTAQLRSSPGRISARSCGCSTAGTCTPRAFPLTAATSRMR
jgi:hypothetical protein